MGAKAESFDSLKNFKIEDGPGLQEAPEGENDGWAHSMHRKRTGCEDYELADVTIGMFNNNEVLDLLSHEDLKYAEGSALELAR